MAANGGNGDVVMANVLLDGPVTERLTATYHANGRDVWVLYHRWESDAYIAYLVTCQGVEGPVVSNIGQAMHGNPDGSGASPIGCMRMNQQGDRLANAWGRSMAITNSDWQSTAYFDVLDFDNSNPGCSPLSAAIPSAAPLSCSVAVTALSSRPTATWCT